MVEVSAAPKVAVAVTVKGVAALMTVTIPVELLMVATVPVVSLMLQVTYGVMAPLVESVGSPGNVALAIAWKVVPEAKVTPPV